VIIRAHLYGRGQSLAVLATDTLGPRGFLERRLSATDLLEFGRCPWRWRWGTDPENYLAAHGPTLTELLSFDEGLAAQYLVRRPDTYESMKLECPKCQSEGPAKICTKCGQRRKHVVRPRPWSSAAKVCAAWVAKVEEQRRTIVSGGEWDRAALGAAAVRKDTSVMTAARSCETLRTLFGYWKDEATGFEIPVWARATLCPREQSIIQPVLVSLQEVRNADPAIWESYAYNTGAHIRAALLLELWNKLDVEDCHEHLWIVVEKDAPRLVARRRASLELLNEGRNRLAELMAAYAQSLKKDYWPRFEPDVEGLLPAWPLVALQPWMTSGMGPHGGYFAPQVMHEQAPEQPADATGK